MVWINGNSTAPHAHILHRPDTRQSALYANETYRMSWVNSATMLNFSRCDRRMTGMARASTTFDCDDSNILYARSIALGLQRRKKISPFEVIVRREL